MLRETKMIQSIQRESLVETLLNTLEAERYVRGPLLRTIVDELTAGEGLEIAADAARDILEAYYAGHLAEQDLTFRVGALRQLVQGLSAPPESGEVLISAARDALSRAVPRIGAISSSATASAA